MKIMFLDESGDHNLEVIDSKYPMFVLAGVIMEQHYVQNELEQTIIQFKRDFFGRTDIILHTADITRNRNGFEELKDRTVRQRFYTAINAMIDSLDFKIVACAIRKDEHLARYNVTALDPYMLSLNVLVERFCFEIGKRNADGIMIAERRNPTLDHQLELAFSSLKTRGTRYLQASAVERRIRELNLRPKSDNIAGLQLADLVATPIGRHVMGKQDHEDYQIIQKKLRKDPRGNYLGHGLCILPRLEKT